MAYLLEFPPSKLPADILAPPYAIIGIQGESVSEMLPPRIPLQAVLHFIPSLAQFVLPAPENLPTKIAHGALREPCIGLDIRLDIRVASLQRIIVKVLQSAGRMMSKKVFQFPPSTLTALSIRKTWLLFEPSRAGLDGLLVHLQTYLMAGPPVCLAEMEALWDAFSSDSDMLRAMFVNFIQSHIVWHYSRADFLAIQTWYQSNDTRNALFKTILDKFPAFGELLLSLLSATSKQTNMAIEEVREAADKERTELLAQKAAEDKATAMNAMEKMVKDSIHTSQKRKAVRKPRRMSMEDLGPSTTISKSMGRRFTSTRGFRTKLSTMEEMTAQLSDALHKVMVERESEAGDAVAKEEETLMPTVYNPKQGPVEGSSLGIPLR
jgi:hypothetical protein